MTMASVPVVVVVAVAASLAAQLDLPRPAALVNAIDGVLAAFETCGNHRRQAATMVIDGRLRAW
jgi:hypothetical protein